MSTQLKIEWWDGFITVSPFVPESLTKRLKYWHRTVEKQGYKMVTTGHYRALYNIKNELGPDGTVVQTMSTMPGFLHKIKTLLSAEGHVYTIVDRRTPMPAPNYEKSFEGLREYQLECAYVTIASGGGMVACPTGWGKCVSDSTPILYYDGTVKTMGEVQIGDLLMGDDSTPRTVIERIDGSGPMYRLTPQNGDPIELADFHILSLVTTDTDKLVDMPLAVYLTQSKTFKHRHKLYKVAINFPAKPVKVDPYFMGMWLGNGDWNRPVITTPFSEVRDSVYRYAAKLRLNAVPYPDKRNPNSDRYGIVGTKKTTNRLLTAMRGYGLLGTKIKRIPKDFMINSREVRLELLAGLLDSDGHYDPNGKFDWCSVYKQLAKDFTFLARSLGFRATEKTTTVTGFGKRVTRYRVLLSGELADIPTRVQKKRANRRISKKNVLRCGFKLERIEDGPYVGVRLDGNMRHVLGDFTVTHNTHIMAAIIKAYDPAELKLRGTPIVVVATPEKDITQKDYNDLVGLLPDRKVGLVMAGVKRFSDDVQVITLDSIHHIDPDEIGILIVDEVHTASSENRTDMLLRAGKAARWGVSATPDGRYDGRDLVTEGLFGPAVYRRSYQQGVTDGALVPITVCWMEVPEPDIGLDKYMRYKTRAGKYRNGLERNDSHNQLVADVLMGVDPQTYQTLCIMPHIEHMSEIVRRCPDVKYVHAQTSNDTLLASGITNIQGISTAERRNTYQSMAAGDLRKVISTHVYKQGVNFPQLGIILNAGGGGSEIAAKQIPGRESRRIDESYGKERSYLVDFRHSWDTETNKQGKTVPGPILKDDMSRERYYNSLGFEQVWYKKVDELPFITRT